MKKGLLFLFAATTMLTFSASAQSLTPRFGTKPNQDNTFRAMTLHAFTVPDSTLGDSISIIPTAFDNYYTDSVSSTYNGTFKFGAVNTTQLHQYDHVTITAIGASGNTVTFSAVGWKTAGTATLSSHGRAVLTFIFDGVYLVEKSRVVQ